MMGSMMRRAMLGDGSTLSLDFTTGILDPRLTFTRSTSGTYIGADGLVKTMAAAPTNDLTKARFDYDPDTLSIRGLLLESSSQNLLLQSNDWNTTWNNPAAITWDGATYVAAPDGTNTAKQITVTSGSSAAIGQAVAAGSNRTISVWLRAGTLTSFSVGAFDAGGTAWGNNADSSCRKISGPGSVTQQTGGLWSVTGLSTTAWTRIQIHRSTTFTTFLAYPGSSSGTINGTAFMWGMQMEPGNGASSLIVTTTSTGLRAQDQMQLGSLSGANFNTSAGTLLIEGRWNKDANSAAFPRSIRFMGSSIQSMAMITSGKTLFGNTPNTSGGSYFEASRTLASAGAFKFGWTLTTAANPALASATVSLNGSSTSITPLGQGAIVNPTSLQFLYGAAAATDYPSMNISSVKYWPYATTAADLNVRTSL